MVHPQDQPEQRGKCDNIDFFETKLLRDHFNKIVFENEINFKKRRRRKKNLENIFIKSMFNDAANLLKLWTLNKKTINNCVRFQRKKSNIFGSVNGQQVARFTCVTISSRTLAILRHNFVISFIKRKNVENINRT